MVIESASSVTLFWLPPDIHLWNGLVTGYTVIYENHGPLQGSAGEGSGLTPLMHQTASIPSPGQQLMNSPDPSLVSLPLKWESVFIEGLEEYHSYSFAVYQENSEGTSPLSESTKEETPEDSKSFTWAKGVNVSITTYLQLLIKVHRM